MILSTEIFYKVDYF